MILLLQDNFKDIFYYQNLCTSAGISPEKIISLIDSSFIEQYFKNQLIDIVIISAKFYNFYTSSILEKYNIPKIIISDVSENLKTIRLISNKSLKYIYKNSTISQVKYLLDLDSLKSNNLGLKKIV